MDQREYLDEIIDNRKIGRAVPKMPIPEVPYSQEELKAFAAQTDVSNILRERGNRYGEFSGHALITQELKRMFYAHLAKFNPMAELTASEKESVDMIFHKLGRIANGDPHYKDSWVDIAGYAKLVADQCKE